MEAIGSSFGTSTAVQLNTRKTFGKSTERRLASQSSCFFLHQNDFFYKPDSGKKLTLRKTKKMNMALSCRSSTPKTNGVRLGNDTGEIRRKNLAVFVSGGGSNFRSIHEATVRGLIHGDVAVLVTDKPSCGGAEYARDNGIPVLLFPKSKSLPEGFPTVELIAALRFFEIDFVLLAGYLKLIPVELVREYPRSILNIHPSLLPAFGGKGFYGLKVHQAVIASGARLHFTNEGFPI